MGVQSLGPKRLRRIARAVNAPIRRAWANGGSVFEFVTFDHVHGTYDLHTGKWDYDEPAEVQHLSTCPAISAGLPLWSWACDGAADLTVFGPHRVWGTPHTDTVHVVCDLEPGHEKRHQCGSLMWWDDLDRQD